MKYFTARFFLFFLIVILFLSLPTGILATHNNNGIKDQCSDFNLEADCQLVRSVSCPGNPLCNDGPSSGTCSYDRNAYTCITDNASIPVISCIERSPLDCGSGVTVCSHNNDGYNCNDWCSNNWDNNVSKNSGKYNSQNPYACKPPFTYSDKTCYMNACLSGVNQECTNAGTLPTNSCPGTPNVQCGPSHSCVYQPLPSCSVTLSVNTTSVTSGEGLILSWTAQNVDSQRRGFGSLSLQGTAMSSSNTPYPALTQVNDTSSDIHKLFQVNFYNASGEACSSNIYHSSMSLQLKI